MDGSDSVERSCYSLIRPYEKQPIANAKILVFNDNGAESLIIEPYEGYRLRERDDDTYSTTQIGIPMQFESMLGNYIAVQASEIDENGSDKPSNEEEQDTNLYNPLWGIR